MLSESRRRCLFRRTWIHFKHVHFAHRPQLEAGESSHKRIWMFSFDNISPPPLPRSASRPFLLRALPWQRQWAWELAASIRLPELWLCCRNCQSASQIGWRGGGDCVNIFWLTEMEGHSGGEEKWGWGKIGRKCDVGRGGSERKCCTWQKTLWYSLIW